PADAALKPPQTVPPGAEQAKPAETQTALPAPPAVIAPPGRRPAAEQAKPAAALAPAAPGRPRRPSESLEAGRGPATTGAGSEAFATQAIVAPSAKPGVAEEFEE